MIVGIDVDIFQHGGDKMQQNVDEDQSGRVENRKKGGEMAKDKKEKLPEPKFTEKDKDDAITELAKWSLPEDDPQQLVPVAEKALATTSHLTEHQTAKAVGILRGLGFISALAGAILVVFVERPQSGAEVKPVWGRMTDGTWSGFVNGAFELVFVVFGIFVLISACYLLRAVADKFNIPDAWKKPEVDGKPKSLIFAEMIGRLHPEKWAKYFTNPDSQIKEDYARNLVLETWLVSEKLVKKHQLVIKGGKASLVALIVGGVWFVLVLLKIVTVGVGGSLIAPADAQGPAAVEIHENNGEEEKPSE